jgi:F-type H+-transporting ATPase subunit epsilon
MHVEVVTPRGTAVSAEADELTAPGARGEFGVLPGHTPFVSALKPGVLSFRAKGQRTVLAVGAGFAEVSGHDRIVVLAENVAKPDEIDAAQVQKELDEADKALKEWKAVEAGGPSRGAIEARRAWAQARLDARAAARA